MPYIKKEERTKFEIDNSSPKDLANLCENPGQLNYLITTIIKAFIGDPSYAKINEAIGAMECAKLEAYRRLASSYEDQKIIINGDVY